LVDHAALQRSISTPICLDESINSLERARQAVELGSCRIINVKPGRVGGITPSIAIHDLAREADVPCWVGGMLESQIGASINAAVASLENFTLPADIMPASRFYERDLATPELEFARSPESGVVARLPIESGIPQRPSEDALRRLTINQATVAP
jgi:O-succinylbenzoate synthase